MRFLRRRSPISRKALTWQELKKLKPGTVLISFEWATNKKSTVIFLSASDAVSWIESEGRSRRAKRVHLRVDGNSVETCFAGDLGLEPYGDRVWHDSRCLVLSKHAKTLPSKPHWQNRT